MTNKEMLSKEMLYPGLKWQVFYSITANEIYLEFCENMFCADSEFEIWLGNL